MYIFISITQQKGHNMVILTLEYLQQSNREQDTFKTSNSFRESVTVTNERVTMETDCRLLEDTVTWAGNVGAFKIAYYHTMHTSIPQCSVHEKSDVLPKCAI